MSSALLLQLTVAHVVKREDVKPLSLSPSLSLRDGLVATGKGLDGLGGTILERLTKPPIICCRCIKETAVCNNDLDRS